MHCYFILTLNWLLILNFDFNISLLIRFSIFPSGAYVTIYIQDCSQYEMRKKYNIYPTGTPRWIHVDSTWILHRYVEDQISTNFHVISAYFFDVISMVEKSTWFPRTFFDVISLVEKSTWFPRTFFDVISMVEKSTLFHVLLSV